ncbi:MAG: prenyltransferase [Bacteroidales bacterium]
MIKMWIKALKVIPRISKEEWEHLDIISRWLVASRAAVFIMTATAGVIGGLLAYRQGVFHWLIFVEAVLGIVFAHATNNLLNDLVDYRKGIDHNNYYRSLYGPHPLEHGFLTKRAFMNYIYVSGAIALSFGLLITWQVGLQTLWLVGAGLFFLLFYTWPLKYFGLGEISVVIVWGPLMIGGTYFVVSGGQWDNWVALVSLVYALGPTTVLLGKHTDKLPEDKAKGVRTLPVILGETATRYLTLSFWLMQYALVLYLVFSKQLGYAMLLVFITLPDFVKMVGVFSKPRPSEAPEGYDKSAWPLYLVAYAFEFNRKFGLWFILGLIIEILIFKYH